MNDSDSSFVRCWSYFENHHRKPGCFLTVGGSQPVLGVRADPPQLSGAPLLQQQKRSRDEMRVAAFCAVPVLWFVCLAAIFQPRNAQSSRRRCKFHFGCRWAGNCGRMRVWRKWIRRRLCWRDRCCWAHCAAGCSLFLWSRKVRNPRDYWSLNIYKQTSQILKVLF